MLKAIIFSLCCCLVFGTAFPTLGEEQFSNHSLGEEYCPYDLVPSQSHWFKGPVRRELLLVDSSDVEATNDDIDGDGYSKLLSSLAIAAGMDEPSVAFPIAETKKTQHQPIRLSSLSIVSWMNQFVDEISHVFHRGQRSFGLWQQSKVSELAFDSQRHWNKLRHALNPRSTSSDAAVAEVAQTSVGVASDFGDSLASARVQLRVAEFPVIAQVNFQEIFGATIILETVELSSIEQAHDSQQFWDKLRPTIQLGNVVPKSTWYQSESLNQASIPLRSISRATNAIDRR
jgi:hypothetical protein